MPSSTSPTPPSKASSRRQLPIRSNQHCSRSTYDYDCAAADEPRRFGQLWHSTATPICSIAPLNGGIGAPNLKLSNNKFLLVLFLCASFLLLASNCLPIVTAATNPRIPYSPPKAEPGECRSIDVRNECFRLNQLHNCTIIRGFLLIVFLPATRMGPQEVCDYGKYSFPLLREITDFVIWHEVKGLRSIRDLFPNLTVIRGRRLFLNYALGISYMDELEVLEFKSLIAIQRGHVYINNCPKLCHLDKINWDRLTLTVGENYIAPIVPESCSKKTVCPGCATDYCWSNDVCQRFENENLIDTKLGIQHCHSECLGGCYNSSSDGCLACKNLSDHGSCVKECPAETYLFDVFQKCYTEAECTQDLNMTIHDNKCTRQCPEGSIFDVNGRDVIGCIPCDANIHDGTYTIFHLVDAERLRGCSTLNASLTISIRNTINEDELIHSLSSLREIRGYLKIVRSSGLTNLKFLSGIKSIATSREFLEADLYGLVLYDNENLKNLWQPEGLKLMYGSIYVHLNKKLCNRKLREFARNLDHDRSKNSLQVNDQEVMCDPMKLTLDIEVLSHRAAKFSWPKAQTSIEVEILYRPIGLNEIYVEHSELDSNICERIEWTRVLTFPLELRSNETHYSYTTEDLRPNQRYACLVKTFGSADTHDARSELKYIITKLNLPGPPIINVTKKTDVSLTLKLESQSKDFVSSYIVKTYQHPDNQAMLDRRDFCQQPSYMYHEGDTVRSDEDHDTCCLHVEEEMDDNHFTKNMRSLFECNLDHKENCMPDTIIAESSTTNMQAMLRQNVDALNSNVTTIAHLQRYRLYTIQVQSCNEVGCGSYAFYWTRTNFTIGGERLETLHACRVPGINEFHVVFPEPKHPNGLITSYMVHFRLVEPDTERYKSHTECLTRAQHVYNDYQVIAQLDAPFNEVAVRVYSLAGGFFTNWVPVSSCPFDETVVKVSATTENEHHIGYGTKIFLVLLVFSIFSVTTWAFFKFNWWRNITIWRRNLALVWARQQRRFDDSGNPLVAYRHQPDED